MNPLLTHKMTSSLQKVMAIMDDVKQIIPEGKYLQMCHHLQAAHNTLSSHQQNNNQSQSVQRLENSLRWVQQDLSNLRNKYSRIYNELFRFKWGNGRDRCCSVCQQTGHNARTCPQTHEPPGIAPRERTTQSSTRETIVWSPQEDSSRIY